MLPESRLKELLASPKFSRIQKILLCLAASEVDGPLTVAQIRSRGVTLGVREMAKWNVSDLLRSAPEYAIRTTKGWELTTVGNAFARQLSGAAAKTPLKAHAESLRALLPKVGNLETVAFVDEAIGCSEAGHYRAAVVLSWVGAVAVLYDHVLSKRLSDFNSEASRRDPKWKIARTADDLARMKEYDLLQILEAIGVLGKNTKQELEGALRLRNACGHPSSLRVGEARTAAHLEMLVLNVFARF